MQNNKAIILFLCTFALVACMPFESDIQVAIAQTQSAIQTVQDTATLVQTEIPASIPEPTSTPEPTYTPTPEMEMQTIEDVQKGFIETILEHLESGAVRLDSVSTIRFGGPGVFEIEAKTLLARKSSQADVSYEIVKDLSYIIVETLGFSSAKKLSQGADFILVLTTYSVDGDYKYQSTTNFALMEKINDKSITYDEWVIEADAGFK